MSINDPRNAHSKFEVHGEYAISVEENMLISRLRGPFNFELASTYFNALAPHAIALARQGQWGSIAAFSQSALFPVGAVTMMREHAEAAAPLSVIANFWVVPADVEGYGFVEIVGRKVYEGLCDFKVFENYDEAHAALVNLLDERKVSRPAT